MTVRITEDDFDIMAEHEALKSPDAGAIVTFTGTVRDLPDGGLNSMTLEHYPGMTESEIEAIITEAKNPLVTEKSYSDSSCWAAVAHRKYCFCWLFIGASGDGV